VRRRLIVLAVVVLLALGVAVAVWAVGGMSDSGASADDCAKTITIQDTASPRMMEYHRTNCDEDFAVDRSKGGAG
jgi:hypothetical protein